MAATAATLWAVNGTVSKVILASGISSLRLTQVRMTGGLIGFVLVLVLIAPERLRVRARELPFLALFSVYVLLVFGVRPRSAWRHYRARRAISPSSVT